MFTCLPPTCQMFVDDIVMTSRSEERILRRSISSNDDIRAGQLQMQGRHQGFATTSRGRPVFLPMTRQLSLRNHSSSSAVSNSLQDQESQKKTQELSEKSCFLQEHEIHAAIASPFEEFFDHFVRWLLVPVTVIVAISFAFVYLPIQTIKADVYRSLAVIFVLLVGVTLQGCFVNTWADRRYRISDLVKLILHWCRTI